jgi:hypothetical protein
MAPNSQISATALTPHKLLPLYAGAGRPPPTGLNYIVSGNERPSAGRLLRRAVRARRWSAAILLPDVLQLCSRAEDRGR